MTMEMGTQVVRSEDRQLSMSESSNKVVTLRVRNGAAKVCKVCGQPIEFNRRTARQWDEVQYCTAVCRRNRHTSKCMPAAS
jgi:hypothetical protein